VFFGTAVTWHCPAGPRPLPRAHCSRLLGALLIAVVTTPIRAITHVIPHILPFFPPLEGAPTDHAVLGGPIGMVGHEKWLRVTSAGTRRTLVFKPSGSKKDLFPFIRPSRGSHNPGLSPGERTHCAGRSCSGVRSRRRIRANTVPALPRHSRSQPSR